ncbi:MAG: hypothetical protein H6658_02225 [Ardenticatenaceae bacterium]|nr:hypothetical protein [Ardenticatenaceae bacterium]
MTYTHPMQPQTNDDRFLLDAKLAVHLLGWSWWLDPQWEWVGLWPPDSPEWLRLNFPDGAQRIGLDELREHKLSPAWMVGGCPANDKNKVGLPRFAADWNEMSVVVQAMARRGFWWRGTHYLTLDDPARATFSTRTADYPSQAETLPRATAMAAVDALEGAKTAVVGELSAETVRGKLTSIRAVAGFGGGSEPMYVRWLEARNAGDTLHAAMMFIAETADAALTQLEAG